MKFLESVLDKSSFEEVVDRAFTSSSSSDSYLISKLIVLYSGDITDEEFRKLMTNSYFLNNFESRFSLKFKEFFLNLMVRRKLYRFIDLKSDNCIPYSFFGIFPREMVEILVFHENFKPTVLISNVLTVEELMYIRLVHYESIPHPYKDMLNNKLNNGCGIMKNENL